ncbi:MAG: GNAT family N-acetyltransferase [Acidimicrobiales bacterium]
MTSSNASDPVVGHAGADAGSPDPFSVELGVRLRAVVPADVPWMFKVETHPSVIWRFRLGGKAPSIGQYQGLVFDNTLDQAVIMPSQGRQPLGFVYASKYDPSNGTAEFGLVADPENPGSGLVLHGAMLFLDRLFRQFSLRKLVSELMEFNRDQFANGEGAEDFGGMFSFETRFDSYYYLKGRYWDRYHLAIFRDNWFAHRDQMIASASRRLERLRARVQAEGTRASDGRQDLAAVADEGAPEAQQVDPDASRADVRRIALETGLFALRPVTPQDEPWCLSMLEQASGTGSLRRNIPTFGPKEVEAELWFGVLAQFVAWDKPNGFPVALISAYDVQGAHALASIHATLDPAFATLDVCVEILPLFVQYVFNCWPFRKIYIRYASGAPELDRWHAAFQSDGRSLWERVGVQVDQLNVAGAYSDVETYELTRERWEAAAQEVWDRCGSRPVPAD